jgi:hypothetical protein
LNGVAVDVFALLGVEDFAGFVVGDTDTLGDAEVEFIFGEEVFSLVGESLDFLFNFVKAEEFFFTESAERLEIINLLFEVAAVLEGDDVVGVRFERGGDGWLYGVVEAG